MKPSIPKGTRDFLPHEVFRRQHIFQIIRQEFELFGYQPIETPVLENLSTLTGKYGEEGDRLLFKVLNNGDFLNKANEQALKDKDSAALLPTIAKRGLRYDLTVPFARFVVMHRNELTIPFKRYQIQPVWRADRPQKGRYHEFYQCDADAIGSDSLLLEAEFLSMIDRVFTKLGLEVDILVNSRKVLSGIANLVGVADRFTEMTVAVDKLAKIGWDGVRADLVRRDFSEAQALLIQTYFSKSYEDLKKDLQKDANGKEGTDELDQVLGFVDRDALTNHVILDPTLARGLNYYTGCIFEVRSREAEMGSILGGGRYADLTGVFGMPDLSGVGISFGVERIYDIMVELDRFPTQVESNLQILLIAADPASQHKAFDYASTLRDREVTCMVSPDISKLKKQMKYANNLGAQHVLLIGLEEDPTHLVWKRMEKGDQEVITFDQFLKAFTV